MFPLPSTVPDIHRGRSFKHLLSTSHGLQGTQFGQSDSFQDRGEIRKVSHRDVIPQTHSMEVLLYLEGNDWMQRDLSVVPHLGFIHCNLKYFLNEASVIYTIGWLTQTPPAPGWKC